MKPGPPGSFGAQLKALREAAGYTQEELATIAGLSVHGVSALERGERRRPHVETVRALSAALDLTGATRDALLQSARAPAPEGPGRTEPQGACRDQSRHRGRGPLGAEPRRMHARQDRQDPLHDRRRAHAGAGGALRLAVRPDPRGRLHEGARRPERRCRRDPQSSSERAELEGFADAIEGRAQYACPPAEAVHGVAVLEAIVRSVRSGQRERVA